MIPHFFKVTRSNSPYVPILPTPLFLWGKSEPPFISRISKTPPPPIPLYKGIGGGSNMFIPFSSVAIVDFKQVNVCSEVLFLICYSSLKCVISQMIFFFFFERKYNQEIHFQKLKLKLGVAGSKIQRTFHDSFKPKVKGGWTHGSLELLFNLPFSVKQTKMLIF